MIKDLLGDPTPFLDRIFLQLRMAQLNVDSFELDHICYRVETLQRYEQMHTQLTQVGELLTNKPVNGRPISTFRLNKPIRYEQRAIHCVELPAPKSGSPYQEGYEHVEFVIDQPLQEFVDSYPFLDFDTKGINKPVNADIRLSFGNISVKFHLQSLEYVIRYLE